jgi:hypothetical protein
VYQNTARRQLSLDRTGGCIKSGFQAPYLEGEHDLIAKMFSRHSAREQVCEAAEAAEAITWLCSDVASLVNGAILAMGGGDTSGLY